MLTLFYVFRKCRMMSIAKKASTQWNVSVIKVSKPYIRTTIGTYM